MGGFTLGRKRHVRLQLVAYVFDLLHLNGRDFTKRPLDERRSDLASVKRARARLSVHDDKSVIVNQFARGCR